MHKHNPMDEALGIRINPGTNGIELPDAGSFSFDSDRAVTRQVVDHKSSRDDGDVAQMLGD